MSRSKPTQAAEAYAFALAHQDQYTEAHIEKLKVAAETTKKIAEDWSTKMVETNTAVADSAKKSADAANASWYDAAKAIAASGNLGSQSWIAGQKEILDHTQQSLTQQIALTDKATQATDRRGPAERGGGRGRLG